MLKKLLIAGVVLIAVPTAAIVTYSIFSTGRGEVILENQANESVDHATIVVCRQQFDFGSFGPGESKAAEFKVTGEDHYDVSVTFHSGRQVSAQVGYVTSGMDFNDKLIVKSESIILEVRPERNANWPTDERR